MTREEINQFIATRLEDNLRSKDTLTEHLAESYGKWIRELVRAAGANLKMEYMQEKGMGGDMSATMGGAPSEQPA